MNARACSPDRPAGVRCAANIRGRCNRRQPHSRSLPRVEGRVVNMINTKVAVEQASARYRLTRR